MSIRILASIWERGPEDRSELLVLLALADFANDAGECWPSMIGVAEKARMTERGAQKIVRRLEETGWLTVVTGGGRGGKNQYRIIADNPERETPNEKRGIENKPRTAEHKPRTGVQETPNGGSPEPSGTIKEPSEEPPLVPPKAKSTRRKPEVPLPENWTPSDRNIADAQARQFSAMEIEDEANRFRDHHLSRDTRFRDWDAAWRTWLGNARRFAGRGMAGKPAPGGHGRSGSIAGIVARRWSDGQV